ncbi:MAG: PEGA domain-containing protein [Planctomycetales bacterium]
MAYSISRFSLGFILLVAASGCVQRRLTIQSNPPGALVRIDGEEIGATPVSTSFVYYGTRKIELIKPGYETMTVLQPVPSPLGLLPIVDVVGEHVGKTRDDRLFTYNLQPSKIVPTSELLQRAGQLRSDGNRPPEKEFLPVPVSPAEQPPLPTQSEPRLPF